MKSYKEGEKVNLVEKYLGEETIKWVKGPKGYGELFDKMGEPAKVLSMTNYNGYDLFVIKRGGKIIPVHGSAEMNPVGNVNKAKQILVDYVDNLPNKSKIVGKSDIGRMKQRMGKAMASKYDR